MAPPYRGPKRDPNILFPGGAPHGEHWTPSRPREELNQYWRQHLFGKPDPEDEVQVLGMPLASRLHQLRGQYHNALYNAQAARVQKVTGKAPKQLSEDEIAEIYSRQAGLEPLLQRAAKTYTDVEVPIPLPFSGIGLAKGTIPYPTGDPMVGHIGALEAFTAAPEFAKWAQTGQTKHPALAAIDAAFLFPFIRPLRGARAAFTAGRTAISGERAARITADVEKNLWDEERRLLEHARRNARLGRPLSREQAQLMKRLESRWSAAAEAWRRTMDGPSVARYFTRKAAGIPAISAVRKRTLRARELETDIPAAKTVFGRGVEKTSDAARRALAGRVPGIKSAEAKALHEMGMRNLKYEQRAGPEAAIRRLQQLDNKINDEQQYALRLSLEGSPPEVALQHHLALAADEELPDETRLFHRMHAEWIEKARRYIHVSADGRPELISRLPRTRGQKVGQAIPLVGGRDLPPMEEAKDLLVKVTGRREEDYKQIGALTNEAIQGRLAGPAKVRAGHRWQEAETILEQELADSPLRQQVEQWAERLGEHIGDSPKELERRRILVGSTLSIFDAGVRKAAQEAFGDQRAWNELLDRLRFGRGEIPAEALTQDAIIQAKAYYEEILKGAPKEVLDEIPYDKKIWLGDLINAQRKAHELGDREAVAALQQEIAHILRSRGLLFQQGDLTPSVLAGRHEQGLSPELVSPFISKMGAAIASIKQPKIDKATLMGRLKSAGVKDEEIQYTQIEEFMEGKKSVPREDLLAWLDENYLQVTEEFRFRHDPPGWTTEQPADYYNWTLAGAREPEAEYGELRIMLPEVDPPYTAGHFTGQNILLHVRFTTRPVNGKRYLLIEELQSDWMQQGSKRGFALPPERHPDFPRRQQELEDATEAERAAIRALRVNEQEQYTNVEQNLGIDLGDRVSVREASNELTYGIRAKGQGSRYEVVVEPRRNAYGEETSENQLAIRLPERDVEDPSSMRVIRPDQQRSYVYGPTELEETRLFLQQQADELNRKFIDPDATELVRLQHGLDELARLQATRIEKQNLLEALRSDAGRGVPDAPFKESWDQLGFKRMLAWAVDNGYEGIAFTTGAQQVERYSLATNFRRIEVVGSSERVPEPGTYEYDELMQEAMEAEEGGYAQQDFVSDWLARNGEPEPDEYEIRQEVESERYDDIPQREDFEDERGYLEAHDQFEREVRDEAEERYDVRHEDWESEQEGLLEDAESEWRDEFAYNFDAEDYLRSQGRYDYDYGDQWEIQAWKPDTEEGRSADVYETVDDSELEDYVGNEMASRIRSGETVFEGDDLMFGQASEEARGLMTRYDRKLRNFAQKYLKKYGVELRIEKLGHRRVTKFYDAFYKAHASTAEAGAGHASLADAQAAIDAAVRHDTNFERWQIVDRTTGEQLGSPFGNESAARYELDTYILPQAREGSDYVVQEKPPLTRDDFQIIPREEEQWVGPEPARKTFSIKHQDPYWTVMVRFPDGEMQAIEHYGTREAAQQHVDDMTERQEALQPLTGAPWGENVHAAALPTPSEKSWDAFIQYKGLTDDPLDRHAFLDPKVREQFAAWHPDQDVPITKLIREGQDLFQGSYMGPKGWIHQEIGPQFASRAVVNFAEHADLTTLGHELFGHWLPRWLPQHDYRTLAKWATEEGAKRRRAQGIVGDPPMPGNFDPERGPVDREAAEAVAEGMEQYIMEGVGPTPVKRAFASLAPYWREIYGGADIQSLTPAVRRAFGRVFEHKRLKGGQLIGPEEVPDFSVARIAYQPGRPLPRGLKGVHHRVGGMTQYILSGGKVIAKGPLDKTLMHEYRGAALMSGYFTTDALGPTARDAILASRIATFHRARESLLQASSELPSAHTDIAIKQNPDKRTPKGAQILLDKMRELDHRKAGLISKTDMEQIDFDLVEEAGRDIFPAEIEDPENPGELLDVREAAAKILNTREPIEGIRWIPAEWLDGSGLIPPPGWKGKWAQAFNNAPLGLLGIDAFNDFQKMLVLYLNPSYVPINLAGNLSMNLMQQGVFLPTNLFKSALMHQWLDGYERKMIDTAMGNGLTASLYLRTGPMQFVNNTLGFWINQAVDLIPRRAAWMHEARRAGYRNKESIRGLLRAADGGDERAIEDMRLIAYRANDAIVDYERMSPLERQITARMIFFYPWLKGATRWSMRFILEHPVQALALMLAAEHAYTYQQQQLGDVPHYEAWDVPVATKALGFQLGVPGIYDGPQLADLSQVFGDQSWVKGGYPMVVDSRQLLTFSTPFDLFRAAYGLVSGNPNTPGFIDNLTPFLSNTITTLQGYDSFQHKEVPVSLKTFLAQSYEGLPQIQRWKQLAPASWGGLSAKERREIQQNAINPRTSEEDFWRLWFSNLAPAPFSREVSAKRTLSNLPTKVQHVENLRAAAKKYGLTPPSEVALAQLDEYDEMNHELKQGMTELEKLDVISKYYGRHPELPLHDRLDELKRRYATSDRKVAHLNDRLRHDLEFHAWRDYWRIRHFVHRAEEHYGATHLSTGEG